MFDFTPKKQVGPSPIQTGIARARSFEDELRDKNYAPDLSQSNQTRANQNQLSQQYNDMIMGRGPSVAERQLFAGQEAAMKGAAAQAGLASARGGGYGQIARGLASQSAQGAMDVNQQASVLRAQEQQQAMAGQAGLLGQTRGQDLQGAQLTMQGQQAKDQIRAQLMGMGLSAAAAEQQAQMQMEQMRLNGEGEKRGFWGGLVGNLAGAGMTLLGGPVAGAATKMVVDKVTQSK